MSKKAFDKIMRGLKEARAYLEFERQDLQVQSPTNHRCERASRERRGLQWMKKRAFSEGHGFSHATKVQEETGFSRRGRPFES